jgi:SAM-dependent methyltransferase
MITKKAIRPCPICSESYVEILHTQDFVLPEGHPLSKGYDVVCCSNCGFVYADVTINQIDFDNFYAKHSIYQDTKASTGSGLDSYDQARLIETAHIISSFCPQRSTKIIDIGCANGGLLKELKNLGYMNLTGVDPSPTCVANTCALTGTTAIEGSFASIPIDIGKFDLIILSHVLEHVQNLGQAVETVMRILDQNGNVYVEVPDASNYSKYVIAPYQDFNTEHINHFSLLALENLFARRGYAPVEHQTRTIETAPNIHYPVMHAFFKADKTNNFITTDDQLNIEIRKYIEISGAIIKEIDSHLQGILAHCPEIIVWGTGQLTMKLLAQTCLRSAHIVAFVDKKLINQGNTIAGVPVISPDDLHHLANYPIIIATLLHHESILSDIRQSGLTNFVFTLK